MVGTLVRRPLPPVSDFIRTLLDDTTATAALATLGITTGTYIPTLTNTANLDASTAYVSTYVRIGPTVSVFGQLAADATAAASTTATMGMSLPVASNLANFEDLAGTASSNNVNLVVRIFADTANDRATFQWLSPVTTNIGLSFNFSYRVL